MLKIKKELLENRKGGKAPMETIVEITMTETHLTYEFFCKNSKFFSADDKYNGPIFDGDVCEAFICTSGDITEYFEIEVAPNNCLFLNKIKNLGNGKYQTFPIPFEENFITSEVEKNGNDYRLKFSMPLEKIGYDAKKGIKHNAFRIETEGGHTDLHLMALSPTLCGNYHIPEAFVELK